MNAKLRVFETCVISTLLYDSETNLCQTNQQTQYILHALHETYSKNELERQLQTTDSWEETSKKTKTQIQGRLQKRPRSLQSGKMLLKTEPDGGKMYKMGRKTMKRSVHSIVTEREIKDTDQLLPEL